jgi:hypothetical protein
MSYPHGSVDERVRRLVQLNGYRLAVTSKFGAIKNNISSFDLARTDIWAGDDKKIFLSKLSGDWDWLGLV